MEMNFPHNALATEANADATSEAAQSIAHRALLAHVIARQSLSYSARQFVANRNERSETLGRLRGQGLANRIRFFAGLPTAEKESAESGAQFVRGHFRPDIAAKLFIDDGG